MYFHYRRCDVDLTPVFSVGRYFARVRIVLAKDLTDAGSDFVF
jgi:hypothetical protein